MAARWLCYVWPGLAQILARAEVSGLLIAMLFAVGLNFLLAATFVWDGLIGRGHLAVLWLVLAIFWLVCVVVNVRQDWYFRSLLGSDLAQDLFSVANKEYLRGRYSQSRVYLQRLIELNPRDAEARMLLVSIELRQSRVEECELQLRHVRRLRAASKWTAEIEQLGKKLAKLKGTLSGSPPIGTAENGAAPQTPFDVSSNSSSTIVPEPAR